MNLFRICRSDSSIIFRTESSKYVWRFNDSWSQWSKLEDQTVMIVYAVGKFPVKILCFNIFNPDYFSEYEEPLLKHHHKIIIIKQTYRSGMLFILISLWNIAITECVPIKNQSTMLIMMVVWDILAGELSYNSFYFL